MTTQTTTTTQSRTNGSKPQDQSEDQSEDQSSTDTSTTDTRRNQASYITELALQRTRLFHSPDQREYARIEVNGHFEFEALRTKKFRDWLSYIFYDEHKKPPGRKAIEDALSVLCAIALHERKEVPVYFRVGKHAGNIYIDLGNDDWEVVEITPQDWKIIDKSPVAFRRSRGMLPLPKPDRMGHYKDLFGFLNLEKSDKHLFLAALLNAYNPEGPYPIVALFSEQGSGKSTVERIFRSLVDPGRLSSIKQVVQCFN